MTKIDDAALAAAIKKVRKLRLVDHIPINDSPPPATTFLGVMQRGLGGMNDDAANRIHASPLPEILPVVTPIDRTKATEMSDNLYAEAAALIRQNVKDVGGCDHSTGICCCADIALAERLEIAARVDNHLARQLRASIERNSQLANEIARLKKGAPPPPEA